MRRSPSLLLLLVLLGAAPAGEPPERRARGTAPAGEGFCPPEMALVARTFCIDRYEARLVEELRDGSTRPCPRARRIGNKVVRAIPAAGVRPYGHVSAVDAAAACERAGKRLCSSQEWLTACRGREDSQFPYGDQYVEGACNDHYPGVHPVLDLFPGEDDVWDAEHMNDPRINRQPGAVDPGGANDECRSDWGVFDLHGNLHEWVADPGGVFRGGFYGDADTNGAGCEYATRAHGPRYRDYSTGFRCCAELSREDPK